MLPQKPEECEANASVVDEGMGQTMTAAAEVAADEAESPAEDSEAWRGELSARLNRYRAKRKIRPPRYPSLSLQFAPVENSATPVQEPEGPAGHPYEFVSHRGLALDESRCEPLRESYEEEHATEPTPAFDHATAHSAPIAGGAGAKIIEFPRFAWGPPAPPEDQLAEPVGGVPRILDVPETTPAPPALGGILIEPAEKKEVERRPGIDLPLQSASLRRRLAASAFDLMIVGLATGLFDAVFWKFSGFRPPKFQLIGLAAGVPAVLWFGYQYLLIVHGATTPGLRIAGLRLCRFDGSETTRRTRRSRVLASLLSAISLGMGYAWVFLDEDVLCWHDRITHTYLAPSDSSQSR